MSAQRKRYAIEDLVRHPNFHPNNSLDETLRGGLSGRETARQRTGTYCVDEMERPTRSSKARVRFSAWWSRGASPGCTFP